MSVLNNVQFKALIGPKSNPLSYFKKAILPVKTNQEDMLQGLKLQLRIIREWEQKRDGSGQRIKFKGLEKIRKQNLKQSNPQKILLYSYGGTWGYFKIHNIFNRKCSTNQNSRDMAIKMTSVKTYMSFQGLLILK